ncbi:MAG: hypothetical protein V4543_03750 [Bacteroidota bacterium]
MKNFFQSALLSFAFCLTLCSNALAQSSIKAGATPGTAEQATGVNPGTGEEQSLKRHILKLNLFNLFVFARPELSYHYAPAGNSAMQFTVFYSPYSNIPSRSKPKDWKGVTYGVFFEPRFYVGPYRSISKGFFLSPIVSYEYEYSEYLKSNYIENPYKDMSSIGIGLQLGTQYISKSGFVADFVFGASYRANGVQMVGPYQTYDTHEVGMRDILLRVGINLGGAW